MRITNFAQKSDVQIVFKDSIYRVEKSLIYENNKCDSGVQIGFIFRYYIMKNYLLSVSVYNNGTLSSIGGRWNNGDKEFWMTTIFKLDTLGRLQKLKFEVMNIESGPEIEFFSNGLIKSIYNYEFKLNDLDLLVKEKADTNYCSPLDIITYKEFFKERNGIEYHYSEDGKIIRMDYWKNDKIIRCDTIK